MEETVEISSYDDAMAAWDNEAVLVRTEVDSKGNDVVYIYPQLPRGYSYFGYNLRHEVRLFTCLDEKTAVMWARSRGYEATVIK